MKYNNYTGFMPTETFIAALIFAALGWTIYKYVTAKGRTKTSKHSPVHWSWRYWLEDNLPEAFIHGVLLYTVVRFAPDLIKQFAPESISFFQSPDHMLLYLGVGFLFSIPLKALKDKFAKK